MVRHLRLVRDSPDPSDSLMGPEDFERHDALHAEMMDAYAEAERHLDLAMTGDQDALAQHLAERRRAFRLSNEVHAEADQIMLIYYSRRRLRYGA